MRALRFVIAAAIALAIWWYATPAYNELLSRILRTFGAWVEPAGRFVHAMRTGAPTIQVAADLLTYNVVLFAGLAAAYPTRRAWRVLVALVIVLASHVVALAVSIEATYATHAGAWSDSHYSSAAQDLWNSLDFIYRIGGMFAIAFACWYAATMPFGARESRRETPRKPPRAARARPRAAASHR